VQIHSVNRSHKPVCKAWAWPHLEPVRAGMKVASWELVSLAELVLGHGAPSQGSTVRPHRRCMLYLGIDGSTRRNGTNGNR
jgi:hypothetical protein